MTYISVNSLLEYREVDHETQRNLRLHFFLKPYGLVSPLYNLSTFLAVLQKVQRGPHPDNLDLCIHSVIEVHASHSNERWYHKLCGKIFSKMVVTVLFLLLLKFSLLTSLFYYNLAHVLFTFYFTLDAWHMLGNYQTATLSIAASIFCSFHILIFAGVIPAWSYYR